MKIEFIEILSVFMSGGNHSSLHVKDDVVGPKELQLTENTQRDYSQLLEEISWVHIKRIWSLVSPVWQQLCIALIISRLCLGNLQGQ